MKIAGFMCSCVGRAVAADHYIGGHCSDPPMALPYILGALDIVTNDKVHGQNKLSGSSLTKCPRALAIESNVPSIIDVRDLDAVTKGVSLHEFLERHVPKNILAEVEFPSEGQPKPILFEGTPYEIELRGRLDVLNLDTAILEDYKSTSEWSQKFRFERGAAEQEWNVQASVYKILTKKCAGIDIKAGVIWSIAQVSKKSKAPGWFRMPITFLSEGEILRVRPFDGEYTVADYIQAHKELVARLAATNDEKGIEAAVAATPLFGKSAKRFDVCAYCTVRGKCAELAGDTQW